MTALNILFTTLLLALFSLSVSANKSALHQSLRRNIVVETPDKDLYGCERHFACGDYALHFASTSQAVADPENYYYASLSGHHRTIVCEASFPTVLLLANVKGCQAEIQSVEFTLTHPEGSQQLWTETKWAYTLFTSDENGSSIGARKLETGHYKLDVKIYDHNSCLLVDHLYEFDIDSSMGECQGDDTVDTVS